MKKLMRTLAFMCCIALAGTAMPVLSHAQDRDHDRDQSTDRDRNRGGDHDQMARGDDARYQNNHYYQQGWKDGQKHKHKNKKFKNDDDRQAYEAGFMHGDRGEQWNKRGHDNDRH